MFVIPYNSLTCIYWWCEFLDEFCSQYYLCKLLSWQQNMGLLCWLKNLLFNV